MVVEVKRVPEWPPIPIPWPRLLLALRAYLNPVRKGYNDCEMISVGFMPSIPFTTPAFVRQATSPSFIRCPITQYTA